MRKFEYIITEFHEPDAKCRGTLADLFLDAHIIPPCGLIPPLHVVASVLRSGGGRGGMGPGCIWEPIELHEDEYWEAVAQLEALTPDDLRSATATRTLQERFSRTTVRRRRTITTVG